MVSLNQEMMIAYRSTNFKVGVGLDAFVLKVGIPSQEIIGRLRPGGSPSGVFITAFNPLSDPVSDEDNAAAQSALFAELQRTSAKVTAGVGEDPAGRWPGEPSYFVEGLAAVDAAYLSLRFRQHAFVWIDADAVPILVCTNQQVDRTAFYDAIETYAADVGLVATNVPKRDSFGQSDQSMLFPSPSHDSIYQHTLQGIEAMRSKSSIDFLSWLYERHIVLSEAGAKWCPEDVDRRPAELKILKKTFRRLVRHHVTNLPADKMTGSQWE